MLYASCGTRSTTWLLESKSKRRYTSMHTSSAELPIEAGCLLLVNKTRRASAPTARAVGSARLRDGFRG